MGCVLGQAFLCKQGAAEDPVAGIAASSAAAASTRRARTRCLCSPSSLIAGRTRPKDGSSSQQHRQDSLHPRQTPQDSPRQRRTLSGKICKPILTVSHRGFASWMLPRDATTTSTGHATRRSGRCSKLCCCSVVGCPGLVLWALHASTYRGVI